MDTNTKYVIGIIVAVVVLLGAFVFINQKLNGVPAGGVDYSAFAQCIKDKGTIFYGAFWCPHCMATKKMFGAAEKLLPYHECSTPDGQSQLQACTDAGVKGYPTWVFADGTRLEGETTMDILAQRTGCSLPANAPSNVPATTITTGSSSPAQ